MSNDESERFKNEKLKAGIVHRPVLLHESLEYLNVRPDGHYIDVTLGLGGHAEAILGILAGGQGRLLGIDADRQAIGAARERLKDFGERLIAMEGNFATIDALHARSGFPPVQGVIADLGVSSLQLESPERGFSFNLAGPLDMRMGEGDVTAEAIVNQLPEHELADLIFRFAEERHSRRIARAIVKARPIRTTTELAQVVTRAIPSRAGLHQIHPATRTFMALRLAVNRELERLEEFLKRVPGVLAPAGRLVVLTFHSLEDRMVKQAFRSLKQEGRMEILTKHVVRPNDEEVRLNPRSRSAKLRAAEKTASQESGV